MRKGIELSRNARATVIIAATAIAITLVAIFWTLALAYTPFAYSYPDKGSKAVAVSGKHVTIRLSVQQTTNVGPHGDWLGYQLQPPGSAQPSPDNSSPSLSKFQFGATEFTIPAHSLVTVIIHNYDSQTALRNTYFTQVQGTVGNVAYCTATSDAQLSSTDAAFCSGKRYQVMPVDLTSHTFTIPQWGVSVPVGGIGGDGSKGYIAIKFTFRSGDPGTTRWQCIVPCGGGLYGFGGPMSQFGYMNGIFHVVA